MREQGKGKRKGEEGWTQLLDCTYAILWFNVQVMVARGMSGGHPERGNILIPGVE